MRFLSNLSRRRRVQIGLAASLIIHLLAITAYQRWAADDVAQLLRPVRIEPTPMTEEPERFRSAALGRLPQSVMERLQSETGLPALPDLPSGDEPPLPELPELFTPLEDALTTRGKESLPREEELADRDRLMMEAFRRKKAQRDRRSLFSLPDADTTDQRSRGRGLAEAIVDSAIAAMGGLARLQAVVDKTVQVWAYDSKAGRWKRAQKRYYWRGMRFREDIRRAIARGFDGNRSWYSRFGVIVPSPSLRQEAERWDFLSRYKGDGILLEYAGISGTTQPAHVIHVTDVTHGGRQWEAFFDRRSHLLVAIREGGVLTEYTDFREVGGILLPYELWVQTGRYLSRYRHEIELNSGLELALFAVPKPRSWSREAVRMVVLEQVGEDRADSALALNIEPIWQMTPPLAGRSMYGSSINLLNTYLLEEFRAAGMSAEGEADRWLELVIDEYYVSRSLPARHQLTFTLTLRDASEEGRFWSEEMEYVWVPLEGEIAINDKVGHAITFQLLTRVAWGLAELLAPPAAAPPGASGRTE